MADVTPLPSARSLWSQVVRPDTGRRADCKTPFSWAEAITNGSTNGSSFRPAARWLSALYDGAMQFRVDVRANLRRMRLFAVVAALLGLATAAAADDAPPLLTIGEILALPVADLQAGRVARVRGVVTLARGNYVVEDDTGGIYAHHIDAASRTGGSSAPGPPGRHDGLLVRCTGQMLGTLETADGTILSLIDGGTTLDAVLPATSGRHASRFTPGTEVAVTGILQLDLAGRIGGSSNGPPRPGPLRYANRPGHEAGSAPEGTSR